jgi:hypothetical protein
MPESSCLRAAAARGNALCALGFVVSLVASLVPQPALASYEPLVGIVQCEENYARDWYSTHASSQALVGLAGLVGVPYETLSVAQLLDTSAGDYTSLWFGACLVAADGTLAALGDYLAGHVARGGSVFLDGPLGSVRQTAGGDLEYRGMSGLADLLGVVDGGWWPVADHAIYTAASEHPVALASGLPPATQLTQGLPSGTETVAIDEDEPGSATLLELVSPDGLTRHPYLVAAAPGGARVLAASNYGSWVGAASCFRNQAPAGYFDNQLLPYLVHGLLWLVGPGDEPFVGLQLSHAPMTVVGRLDGDWSDEHDATDATFAYLVDLARTTGVATAYGIVTSFVRSGDWALFQSGGKALEALGGAIGSHSRSHDYDMSAHLDEAAFTAEVAGSLQTVRDRLADGDYSPDATVFINPGNTIQQAHYGRFFADIELYMTHGFETSVPYASGVMGFGLPPAQHRPVVNNTPVPDFQWLYLESWPYTVAQAASFQSQILDYYQDTVGRGVLYNQMWHDYAMSDLDPPVNDPGAASIRPLFDANRDHFATRPIYAPGVRELVGKMHLAHKARFTSSSSGQRLDVALDLSRVPAAHREYLAGMGLRVNRSASAIAAVTIDGVAHPGFARDTVILPRPGGTTMNLQITLGPAVPDSPHLSYISKPFSALEATGDGLAVELRDAGLMTRLCVQAADDTVLLGLSRYAVQDGQLCGELDAGATHRRITLARLPANPFRLKVLAAGRLLRATAQQADHFEFELGAGAEGRLRLALPMPPTRVRIDGVETAVDYRDGILEFAAPATTASSQLVQIYGTSCSDADGDGVTVCDRDCDDGDPAATTYCEDVPPPVVQPGSEAPGSGGGCTTGGGVPAGTGAGALLVMLVLLVRRAQRLARSSSARTLL